MRLIVNNLGIIIYTFLFGKQVGNDNKGNRFFINKNKNKKWVLYKENIDPTQLSVEWHQWLTNFDNFKTPDNELKTYKWVKNRDINYTGTKKAYHPQYLNDKLKKQNDSDIWSPNQYEK